MLKEKIRDLPQSSFSEPIHYSGLEYEVKRLSGKILTIIDSSIAEERQNKAIKDLIKSEIRIMLYKYQAICSDGRAGHGIPDKELENK